MNMKNTYNEKNNELINPEFADLFETTSDKNEIQHEARMIMYRFLSEIERISNQKRGLKKKLSDILGRSKSYVTQLFNGDKIINLVTLAKFQKALGIKFKIIAYPEREFDKNLNAHEMAINIFVPKWELENNPSTPTVAKDNYSKEFVQITKKSNYLLS
jgi:transcriptional regulator with XRE-family HTH domain